MRQLSKYDNEGKQKTNLENVNGHMKKLFMLGLNNKIMRKKECIGDSYLIHKQRQNLSYWVSVNNK